MGIMQYVTAIENENDGCMLRIPVNETCGRAAITEIVMYVQLPVADEEDEFCGAELALHWDALTLQNNGGGDTGLALLRGEEDAVGEVMRELYDGKFLPRLGEILAAAGFGEDAITDI